MNQWGQIKSHGTCPGGKEIYGDLDIKALKGLIEFKNVKFKYGSNSLFENLNFKINCNKMIAIVGKSG